MNKIKSKRTLTIYGNSNKTLTFDTSRYQMGSPRTLIYYQNDIIRDKKYTSFVTTLNTIVQNRIPGYDRFAIASNVSLNRS